MVLKQGGIQNRPGTEFIHEVADSTNAVRLIPFIFNRSQAYVIEFYVQSTTLYARPYYDGSPILETATNITAITNANPGELTIVGHGYTTNDEIYLSGIGGMTELNNKYFRVIVVNANTIRLRLLDAAIGAGTIVNTTSYGVYTSGGTAERIVRITCPPTLPANSTILEEMTYAQSADVMTICHTDIAPFEIARTSDTNWSATTITFAPGISAPSNVTATPSGGGSGSLTNIKYQVTAVMSDTLEESLPATSAASYNGTIPSASFPWTVAFTAVSGASQYNIYRSIGSNAIYGFVGYSATNSFVDTVDVPDFENTPPIDRETNFLKSADNRPACVTYHQQRLVFANSNNYPERIWGSKIGLFKNFTIRSPQQDDDAVTFQISGNEVSNIRHLIGLKRMVVMTESGEWTIEGNDAGSILPSAINPKQHSYNGIGNLRPLIVNGNLLYVQAQGSAVRSLAFTAENDGFAGTDLTLYSSHLFEGYELVDWAYQQIPNYIAWAVRDDGVLLGFTYIPEQEMFAWHRHDFTSGTVENVCVIPEGENTALYLVVNRTIDGLTKRYLERMSIRYQSDVRDYKLMDSCISYDGRNTDTTLSMVISGGSAYTHTETLTLTCYLNEAAPTSYFTASDVGNQIHLTGADGTEIRFTIEGYSSASAVTGRVHRTVPTAMRFPHFISTFGRAVDELAGLDHLEGEDVSIFADGFVIASPNNSAYTTYTVSDGAITLPTPRMVIRVGLPFTSDVETLDIDTPSGETLSDKNKLITKVSMFVEKSRGLWIGPRPPSDDTTDPLEDLREPKLRNNETYDEPTELKTEVIYANIPGEWNSNGRIFIRQVDPLPLTILSIIPSGYIPKVG